MVFETILKQIHRFQNVPKAYKTMGLPYSQNLQMLNGGNI